MKNKKELFSLIFLFTNNDDLTKLSNLLIAISNKFKGNSALVLPPHITLIKWYSSEFEAETIFKKFELYKSNIDIRLEKLEISKDKKSLWYKVDDNKRLVEANKIISNMIKNSEFKIHDIMYYNIFHQTIAYKDYSINEILEIKQFVEKHELSFDLFINRVVLCKNENNFWKILDEISTKM